VFEETAEGWTIPLEVSVLIANQTESSKLWTLNKKQQAGKRSCNHGKYLWHAVKDAIDILKSFDIEVEVDIVSAHRTPKSIWFCNNATTWGISVIIAGAGGAAHLRLTGAALAAATS
jgi:hypothetical protein